jgi:hypothetical protein
MKTLYIIGDIDNNEEINVADLVLLKQHILRVSAIIGIGQTSADINKDGKMTISDLLLLKKQLLQIGE